MACRSHVDAPRALALCRRSYPDGVAREGKEATDSVPEDGGTLELLSSDDPGARPRLGTPSIAALIQDVSSTMTLADVDRDAMIDAMRVAAEKRVEGILRNSRRRHYGHAAMRAASCVAIAPTDRGKDVSVWLARLRGNAQATSRVQRGTDARDGEPRVDASRLTPCCERSTPRGTATTHNTRHQRSPHSLYISASVPEFVGL